jgi:hypothetical protein
VTATENARRQICPGDSKSTAKLDDRRYEEQNVRSLDLANGKTLPARDQDLNYYPTVSPVAAGGYFWAFFTSRRTYGNVMTQLETDAVTKKI